MVWIILGIGFGVLLIIGLVSFFKIKRTRTNNKLIKKLSDLRKEELSLVNELDMLNESEKEKKKQFLANSKLTKEENQKIIMQMQNDYDLKVKNINDRRKELISEQEKLKKLIGKRFDTSDKKFDGMTCV